jgi:ATP-binding cassette, subfamily F, member 1
MGIYNQHFVERLPMNKTPIEHLRDRFEKEDYQSIRNRLGRYGLEGHAHEVTMRDLSGGQKARVVFVELSLQEPHVLLLDEPTNVRWLFWLKSALSSLLERTSHAAIPSLCQNLDIETIDALCDAINNFNGGIVVVTHDQRLIEECECTLWVVEKQGVTRWDAGFDDYKETILRELEEAVEKEAVIRREKLEATAKLKAEKMARLALLAKK